MLIRVGYEIAVEVTSPTAVYTYLNVHPQHKRMLSGPARRRLPAPDISTSMAMSLCARPCLRERRFSRMMPLWK